MTATFSRRFVAVADTTVDSSAPDSNYGDDDYHDGYNEIGDDPFVTPTVQIETWLQFDLAAIPVSATVQNASLTVYVHPGGEGNANISVLPALDGWHEYELTWNDRPPLDTTVDQQPYEPLTPTITFNITELTQEWVTGHMPNFGLALQGVGADSSWLRFLSSRESEMPPELIVDYQMGPNDSIFAGLVQEVGYGPPEDHPLANIPVRLYVSSTAGDLGVLADDTTSDADGQYALHYVNFGEMLPVTYTVVMSDPEYTVITAFPEVNQTPEGRIAFGLGTMPGTYATGFHIEPSWWPFTVTHVFTGSVSFPGGGEPAEGVEVVIYAAGADINHSIQVLAGASTGPDGAFRLPLLEPTESFTYVVQVADTAFQVESAGALPPGLTTEDHRVTFHDPAPETYPYITFTVQSTGSPREAPARVEATAQTELRPVVAVLLTPQCTCGFTECTNITNTQVLNAFGQTLFNTSGDSIRNFFLEMSQDEFGYRQAGLFQVVPMDDPATANQNESNNCAKPDWTGPPQHRAYVAQRVLGQQLSFNFANWDADSDGTVEEDELIVVLATTDRHTGNARMRNSDPRTVQVGNVNVRVNYVMVQPGTDFSTIAHEMVHATPHDDTGTTPGDMYGGEGNAGTYGLMDNHCHGRINELDPNVPYTPTQHIVSRRPHLDPWNKIELGWITPTVITGSQWVYIDMVEDTGTVYLVRNPNDSGNEYFLVENRFPADSEYETALPDSGLAIWHVNESLLPAQHRAVALERAGGGANSGAGSAFCNDDADNTALWDGSEDFHRASAPNSDYRNGTDSNVAVLCVGPPGPTVQAYLSGNWTQTVLPQDAEEPNPTSGSATQITMGTYDRTLHAPCDTDVFELAHWKNDVLTVTVQTFSDAARTIPSTATPLIEITDDNFYFTAVFTGTGTVTASFMYQGAAYIEISESSLPVYYRMTVTSTHGGIPADRFDDEKPTGEQRNDSFANRATITQSIAADILLTPGLIIYDLNLEKAADQDWFTIQLPPATNPSSGQSECLSPGDTGYGDPDTTQGAFTVRVSPTYKRPFTIRLYRSDGSEVTSSHSQVTIGTLQATVECPHDTGLFTNGQVVVHIDDPSGQVNFYEIDLWYHRWYMYKDFPEWLLLTDPPMFRELPIRWGPIWWMFPGTPWIQDDLLNGVFDPPHPTEFIPFRWESHLPLTMDVLQNPANPMNVRLFNADGDVIAAAEPVMRVAGTEVFLPETQLHMPDMAPGWYALGIDGPEWLTEFGLRFHYWPTYLPLVLREQ
jgi:M6 family metalloprotease-like protein